MPAVAVMVPRIRRKQSGLLRPCDPIRTIWDSESIDTRAQEPEILNILNWPEVMLSGILLGDGRCTYCFEARSFLSSSYFLINCACNLRTISRRSTYFLT